VLKVGPDTSVIFPMRRGDHDTVTSAHWRNHKFLLRKFSSTHKADCDVNPWVLWRRVVLYLTAVYQLGSQDATLLSCVAVNKKTDVGISGNVISLSTVTTSTTAAKDSFAFTTNTISITDKITIKNNFCYNYHNSDHFPSSCLLFKTRLNSQAGKETAKSRHTRETKGRTSMTGRKQQSS
jgi:hypothetical protein